MSARPVSPVAAHALAIVAACVACIPAIAADRVKFDAGLWQHMNRVSSDGASWQPVETARTCLSEAQTTSWDAQVREQIAAAHCTIDRLSVADGRISGVIACPGIYRYRASVSGQYTSRAYSIDVVSSAVLDMSRAGGSAKSPITRFAQWRGHRIGACRPSATR